MASTIGAMLPTAPLMLLGGGAPALTAMGAARTAGTAAANSAVQGAVFSESGDYLSDAAIGGGLSMGATAAGQIDQPREGRAHGDQGGGAGGAQSAANVLTGASRTFWPVRSARACSCCRGS